MIIFDLDGTLVDLSVLSSQKTIPCFLDEETAALLASIRIALVTGSSRNEVDVVFAETGLERLLSFVEIIAAEDGGNQKKSGTPFLNLRSRYEEPSVVIGDSDSDQIGAEIAGLPFIRVQKKNTKVEQQRELHRCVENALNLFYFPNRRCLVA